jgi:hypothetical protein
METIKFDFETKELSRNLLTTGYTKKIDCIRYWDAHGEKSEWEPEQYNFDEPKKFEIVSVVTVWLFKYSAPHTTEWWYLYVDGQELSVGEIMKYEVLKTKLKLTCCIGSG